MRMNTSFLILRCQLCSHQNETIIKCSHNLNKHIHILDDSPGIMSTGTISMGFKRRNIAHGDNCSETFLIPTFMSFSRVHSQLSR